MVDKTKIQEWEAVTGFPIEGTTQVEHNDLGAVTGGFAQGKGYRIDWQRGPITADNPINGAFLEPVLYACYQRLQSYQETHLRSEHNELAMAHIEAAIQTCVDRLADRKARGVRNTYKA